MSRGNEITDCIRRSVEKYFKDLDGEIPHGVYDMVLRNVEKPLIEIVLEKASGNITTAAEMLGMTRNTLRKKMQMYKIK